MKQRNTEEKKQNAAWFFFMQILLGVLDSVVLMTLGVILAVFLVYNFSTPAAKELVDRKIAQTSIIYDRSGENVLYEIHGEENRKLISHEEIPDTVRIATIATEDKDFYQHAGIDLASIIRAIKVNFTNDDIRQGGSTITQQLVRNAFLTREKTLKRKFLEMIIAIKMERHYTKDQILDFYLNEIPYGANAYGIESAAEVFFGKRAKDLTLDEAALLAALPKAPTYFSPYNTHRDELYERQQYILNRISELGLASQEQVQQAQAVDVIAKVKPFRQQIKAPHFVFYVIEQIEKEYGKEFIETGGLKIYTSLDWNMQQRAEQAVQEGARRNLERGATNASLVAINPKNGEILSMVGSKDFFDESIDGQVNIAISPRQPGSSFKPFAYATAFEKGYQPETMILDAPTNFGADGSGRNYVPRNYDGKFHGMLSMREALAQSLNIPAVKTLYLAGIDATIDMAHRLGITTLNDRQRYGLSLVLGGGEVKLLDMTSAFSVFANEGMRNPAQAIVKISDSEGEVYFENKSNPKKVLDTQITRKISSILSDNKARTPIFGPKSSLILDDGRPVAAKTGTTQEFRDAWTVGYTPSLAVGVWAGNNNNRSMKGGSDGVFVAAPIWKDFMESQVAGKDAEQFIAYDKQDTKIKMNTDKKLVAGAAVEKKIRYFYIASGKEVSAEKVSKMDPEKVKRKIREKIEYNSLDDRTQISQTSTQVQVAMPDKSDPMYKRWSLPDKDKAKSFFDYPFLKIFDKFF